jgi:hypothetical protein
MHVTALLRVSLAEREGFEPSVQVLARTTVQQSIGFFYGVYSITWHALSASQSCRMYFTITLTDTQCATHLHLKAIMVILASTPYPGRMARKFLVGKSYL